MKNDLRIANKYIKLSVSAKDRNIDFNLSLTKLINIYKSKKCFYTGEILNPDNFSIDRVNNDLGYIDSNIVACTSRINQCKGNMTLKDFMLIYKKLKRLKLVK